MVLNRRGGGWGCNSWEAWKNHQNLISVGVGLSGGLENSPIFNRPF